MRWSALIPCALLPVMLNFSRPAVAAPPLTIIEDTLYNADGSPFEGILIINWRAFEAPDSSPVPANSLTVQVRQGKLYVKLVPTTTAPSPAYYSVRYVSSGAVQFTELWSVPPSPAPLRVRDVRVQWPPSTTSSGSPATGQITVDDVAGLRQELDIRPVMGATYSPFRVAVIGASGQLEAAAGDPGDCVRVDGTAGPCGLAASSTGFVDSEVPSGTIDGTNATFTLTATPNPASSLQLFRNGLLLKQGLDYSLSGNVIQFVSTAVPQPGDTLLAHYRKDATATAIYGFVDAETPQGAIDGVNARFTLSSAPNPGGSLQLYRNGLLQRAGVDYTLSGNTVTFLAGALPQPGDTLVAWYRVAGN